MDWKSYEKLWNQHAPSQEKLEYFLFLQFVESYFQMRGVVKPMVVEIGVRGVAQASYYTKLLGADYLGIDIQEKKWDFIIQGDSTNPKTLQKLKDRLGGRPIDLLFIDGWHTYDVAKSDWDMYSPLAKHLVALHDINWKINFYPDSKKHNPNGPQPSVSKLWDELDKEFKSMISFRCPGTITVADESKSTKYYGDPGIGVILMDRLKIENRWVFEKVKFDKMWGVDGRAYPRFGEIK